MSKKKLKNVPPVTEEKPQSLPEPELIPSPATGEDERAAEELMEAKPLTPEQRLDRMEQQLAIVDKNFEVIGKFFETQKTPVAAQPAMGGSVGELAGIIKEALTSGGGSNPLQEKMNNALNIMLDKAIEKMTKPSAFESYFEDEMAKAKAKAMAASIVQP